MRNDIKVVTGYVPIKGHPRSAAEYGELGEKLFGKVVDVPIHAFYETVPETWLAKLIQEVPFSVTPSVADNPAKNTIAYHCVQHQKFGWLLKAAITDPTPDTFVWMDYGIGHVPGVTPDVVNAFLASVQPNDFAIPGCWTREEALEWSTYMHPSWRFCGGLMVVPRAHIHRLYKLIKQEAGNHIQRTKNVTWEVNSLAAIERCLPGPLRWYKADHNETMFTAYGAGICTKH